MKILVTGATGLIGKKLVASLLADHHEVNFLTTSKDKLTSLRGAYGYYWNPDGGYIDESALIGVTAIVHLAGEPIGRKWTPEHKEAILESRIVPANLLYKVLKHNPHQVKMIVSASAIGIYPDSTDAIYTESFTGSDKGFLGQVVEKWEWAVGHFANLGIKTCVMRTGLVISREGGFVAEMEKSVGMGLGTAFGNGRQINSWIHVDDLVDAYKFVLGNGLQGVINVVAPHPVSNEVLVKELASAMKKPQVLPPIPAFALKIFLGEMHLLLVTGQYVVPKRLIDAGFHFKFEKIDDAFHNLYS